MQAITVAIGKGGINFFARELIAKELVKLLSGLKPPDRTINIARVDVDPDAYYKDIVIKLTQGSLQNFTTAFQSITQQDGGNFPLVMQANNFSAQYNWEETAVYYLCYTYRWGRSCSPNNTIDNKYIFTPAFSAFSITVPLQFKYDNHEWSFVAGDSTGIARSSNPNIPADSIIQYQEGCFVTHVSDATADAVSAIDFNSSINKLIAGNIAGIAGSGDLGNGIVYDFSLGDSGILFPNNDGIQMGVKGGASYNGTAFSAANPPTLPLPTPPTDTDTHHLNMYVSNYEVDALNWAYYEAGKLNLLIEPQDIPDPQLLDVSTYITLATQLAPYAAFVMFAQVTQKSAPVTSFQTVYIYTEDVMTLLQKQLPADVYQLILGLGGNAYLSLSDVETFLQEATVPTEYFAAIETAAKMAAMTLTQDIGFSLLIQNDAAPHPYINFSVSRQDVLTDLKLGISKNNTQTMQFGFVNAENTATFENSSIPGLNGTIFESLWLLGLESSYAQTLSELGSTGVPLPIMEDFQFDFTNAELSVQENYVSILANVLYKKEEQALDNFLKYEV